MLAMCEIIINYNNNNNNIDFGKIRLSYSVKIYFETQLCIGKLDDLVSICAGNGRLW